MNAPLNVTRSSCWQERHVRVKAFAENNVWNDDEEAKDKDKRFILISMKYDQEQEI